MTQDIIKLNESYKEENYIEQDGVLYCWLLSRGNLEVYIPEESTYTIKEINTDSITAVVNVVYSGVDKKITKNIDINLTKKDNNWQISKYHIKKS